MKYLNTKPMIPFLRYSNFNVKDFKITFINGQFPAPRPGWGGVMEVLGSLSQLHHQCCLSIRTEDNVAAKRTLTQGVMNATKLYITY